MKDDPLDLNADECKPFDERGTSDPVVPPVQGEDLAALHVSNHKYPVELTLDTGATSNMDHASSTGLYGFPLILAS